MNVTWKSGKLGEEGMGLGEEEILKIKVLILYSGCDLKYFYL